MTMSVNKKAKRAERKRKKLLAEIELASSNDAVKRPGELLDSGAAKKERLDVQEGAGVVRQNDEDLKKLKKQLAERKKILQQPQPRMNVRKNAGPFRLNDEDFKRLKKQLATRKKSLQQQPRLMLQRAGNGASFSTSYDERIPILMSDVQHLLVYALCGNGFTPPPNRWCHLQKCNRLTNIVVLVVEGVSSSDFLEYEHVFTNLTEHFSERVEVRAPMFHGSSAVKEFSKYPLAYAHKQRKHKTDGGLQAAVETREIVESFLPIFPIEMDDEVDSNSLITSTPSARFIPTSDEFPRTLLLLNSHQMLIENFPLPNGDQFVEHYKMSRTKYDAANENSPMFSIDCEMCQTTRKLELTHIAVVNEKHEVIYETLVKPYNHITNYLTQYSGITESMLEGVTTRLEDVQEKLREILPSNAILVGHSLNSDMHALELTHPYVIDTSVIYSWNGGRNRKSKLSFLTARFLGEEIQTSKSGHSPSEDAEAAMKLVQLKLSKSFNFGASLTADDEDAPSAPECQLSTSIFNNSVRAKKTAVVIGTDDCLTEYQRFRFFDGVDTTSYKTVSVKHSEEAIFELEKSSVLYNFSIAHVDITAKLTKSKPEEREKVLREIDSWCSRLISNVSLNGMGVIVFAGPTALTDTDGELQLIASSDSSAKYTVELDKNGNTTETTMKSDSISEVTTTNPESGSEKVEKKSSKRLNGAAFIRIKTPN